MTLAVFSLILYASMKFNIKSFVQFSECIDINDADVGQIFS